MIIDIHIKLHSRALLTHNRNLIALFTYKRKSVRVSAQLLQICAECYHRHLPESKKTRRTRESIHRARLKRRWSDMM